MAKLRHIALLMGQDLGFCREVIRGIRAYAIGRPNWAFRNGPPDMHILPALREWRPDGIIGELFDPAFVRGLRRLGKPVVDTACWLPGLRVHLVDVDHVAVGRLAAEYLLALGLSHFAFFGSVSAEYSRLRECGFRERLAEARREPTTCHGRYLREAPAAIGWRKMDVQIRRWLRGLPKPVGIFAANDVMARGLADMCTQLGLHVPDEVALLGVDNDELECLLTSPPLSSIAIPGERIGYEAAKMLDRAMSGRRTGPSRLLLPPIRVVARQSTDTLAVSEPVVLEALRYIHAHAVERIGVADVVRAVTVGRRELERKFRRVLGRTVLQELCRTRIRQAQKLLASTDLPMPAVARLSGFSSAHRLAIVFRRTCGLPPTGYRRQSQICDGREVVRATEDGREMR